MFHEVPYWQKQCLRYITPKARFNQQSNNCPERTLGLQIDERPVGIVKLLKLLQETTTHSHSWKVSLSQIKPASLTNQINISLKEEITHYLNSWKKTLALYTKDSNLNVRLDIQNKLASTIPCVYQGCQERHSYSGMSLHHSWCHY